MSVSRGGAVRIPDEQLSSLGNKSESCICGGSVRLMMTTNYNFTITVHFNFRILPYLTRFICTNLEKMSDQQVKLTKL